MRCLDFLLPSFLLLTGLLKAGVLQSLAAEQDGTDHRSIPARRGNTAADIRA
jgi:hypothetical protein